MTVLRPGDQLGSDVGSLATLGSVHSGGKTALPPPPPSPPGKQIGFWAEQLPLCTISAGGGRMSRGGGSGQGHFDLW
jgi:hypothetical protein